jgi:hypothetical protein
MHGVFWWGHLRENENLKDLDIDGTKILKWISRSRMGEMEWIDLARDSHSWQAVMNLPVPKKMGNFLISCDLLVSQE